MADKAAVAEIMDETEEIAPINPSALQEFTCERCAFVYHKKEDYQPYLCYRCLRYIAKKVFVIMNTITPPTSRPVVPNE